MSTVLQQLNNIPLVSYAFLGLKITNLVQISLNGSISKP